MKKVFQVLSKKNWMQALMFCRQVIEEGRRIVWPSRREVVLTGAVVIVFAIIFGLFLSLVDNVLVYLLKTILGIV